MQVLSTGKTGKTEAPPPWREESVRAELADAPGGRTIGSGGIDTLQRRLEDADLTAASSKRSVSGPRPLRGWTVKMNSPLGDLYVTINEDETGRPFEVFCTLGKAGGAAMADAEALGRLALRWGGGPPLPLRGSPSPR